MLEHVALELMTLSGLPDGFGRTRESTTRGVYKLAISNWHDEVTRLALDTGIDLIMADVKWLEDRADRIEAIFITHAHEDHVGAIGHLWPKLRAPVNARPFTAAIATLKMEEQGQPLDVIRVV